MHKIIRNLCGIMAIITSIIYLTACSKVENSIYIENSSETYRETESKSENVSSNKNTVLDSIYAAGVTQQQLCEQDFLLYYVNCGTEVTNTADDSEMFGLFQSVTDRKLSADETTGYQWGYYNEQYLSRETESGSINKLESKWVINTETLYENDKTGIYYQFDVPRGSYEITCGFYDPFSARTIDITAEDCTYVQEMKILKYRLTEACFTTEVTDGALNLYVGNAKRGVDAMKNPILSYIYIRAVPVYDTEVLSYTINNYNKKMKEKIYSKSSQEAYEKVCAEALECIEKEEGMNRDKIEEVYKKLKTTFEQLKEIEIYECFTPGGRWYDLEGNIIQAHGGQVQKLNVYDEETGDYQEKWWWVGENKTLGYRGGICAYSSVDLYNWKFEGEIMRNLSSREQLEKEEYFKSLYAGYTEEQLDEVYNAINDTTSVIERPKLIYNEKNQMYVLWFHADGPTKESDSNYAAACAGVAVSKSPAGPFRYMNRYRLNVCPENQEDMYPQSKGMARDMNLFVDDDKTAYIIYSSEENLTIYISKLNENYTSLETPPEKAVYGKDFIRLFPGAQREAPAVFKRNGKYYMMTSGATGWNPNKARYYRADSMLGEWFNMGDPCINDTKETTFDSQSTCIFCVDEEKDIYIYMGDRWNSDNLGDSRYIWLPVAFNEEGNMSIHWTEQWKWNDMK